MISESYRNYSRRDSPPQRRKSRFSRSGSSSNSNSSSTDAISHSDEFIYKGGNKQHWEKLQSKIKQRMMTQNIYYIEDEVEMARRTTPSPPSVFLPPPAFLKTAVDKEERTRQQKLIDQVRRKKDAKF